MPDPAPRPAPAGTPAPVGTAPAGTPAPVGTAPTGTPGTAASTLGRELRDYVAVSTPRHRRNALVYSQIPFAAAMVVLAVVLRADEPAMFAEPGLLAGLLITGAATVAAVVAQWQRIPSAWLSVIPLIDIVAVILLRAAAADPHEDVGLFVIAPVIWLALLTPLPLMLLGFVGLEFAVLYPLLAADQPPNALYDATILIIKPGLVIIAALAVRIGSSRLRQRQRQTAQLAAELELALEASRKRESIVRTVLDSVTAAIVMFDANGKLTLANRVAEEMGALAKLPFEGAAVVPGELQLYRPDRTTPVAIREAASLFEFINQLTTDTVYWIGAPGNQRAVVATASALDEEATMTDGTVAVVYDVTNLIEAVRVRDEFVSTTSHELRTPLTSILGYLDLIDAPALGIEAEISVIERNAMRLLGMISDLLDVKVQTALQRREVDLAVLIGSAAGKRQASADAAGVTLIYDPADSGSTSESTSESNAVSGSGSDSGSGSGSGATLAVVDAVAIGRVVDNLLSNAIKFCRPGGTVTVTLEVDDAVAMIAVADTGVGISVDHQRRIFEQFFRTPSAQDEAIPGTGLGLTVTQSILEAHDATITVESELGRGTTMIVALPRWPRQLEVTR